MNEIQPVKHTSDPMALWKHVDTTDPAHTKSVSQRGGFTAIDAHSQLLRATQLWGPYGDSWGLSSLEWTMSEGGDNLALQATFSYPTHSAGGDATACFPISVDMPFKPNDDCRKKLMTEARSKALSYLGFNADVFLGRFDDNRYVEQMRARYDDEEVLVTRIKTSFRSADTDSQLEKRKLKLDEYFSNESLSKAAWEDCLSLYTKEKERLNG